MNTLDFLATLRIDRDLNADPVRKTLFYREMIQQKPFLKRLYYDLYGQFKKVLDECSSGLCVELGSGGGILKEVFPGVVTSDVLPLSWVDRQFSALQMPFESGTVDLFLMTNVFHHIPDAQGFLREAERCLAPGGRILMIEPANTLWAAFVYRYFHHEAFDPQGAWSFDSHDPLTSANQALPWIVFFRDRARFNKEFLSLEIGEIFAHTPFRLLLSGGVSTGFSMPARSYGLVLLLERLLSSLNPFLGMLWTIDIRKKQ